MSGGRDQAWTEAETSTAVDIAKTEREARRRRQRKSPTGVALEAEIKAFERQMSRWQKFLSKEESITLLQKINKIVEARLIDLDNRYAEEVAP